MPVVDKVNAAHPVSPEVRIAQERLLALLSDDPRAAENARTQADSRMALRAMNCSKSVSIGRFDSVAAVKALTMDTPCFQEQDAELLKLYGIRTIGVLLAKPPLRPLKAAGPIAAFPNGKLANISAGVMARDAGVGVIVDGRGNGFVVEVPGAAPIAQLQGVGYASSFNMRMSPNGRIVLLHGHDHPPEFIEAETGNRIWSLDGTLARASRLLAWLPEVSGFVMSGADGNVMLADGVTGRMDMHPQSIRNSSFATTIAGSPPRLLMGTAHELVLLEHVRTAQGIAASPIRSYRIDSGPGITSGNPVAMQSGHLAVYVASRDLGWLDLDNGTSGTWRTSGLFANTFAKLDESHLMIDSVRPGQMSLAPWSFDVATQSLTPVDLGGDRGAMIDIGDRVGFLRHASEGAWFGDAVTTTGEAQSLDKVMAEFELQQQMAKAQAQLGADGATYSEARRSAPGAVGAAAAPLAPGLGDLPADAQVQMVGVYEPKGRSTGPVVHSVRVEVRPSGHPIVLVLSAYESVNWVVVNQGARIAAVLVSGYNESKVNGTGDTRVLRIGSAYAYSANSPEYLRLRQAVTQYTGAREIRSFQGTYSGADFLVGGN